MSYSERRIVPGVEVWTSSGSNGVQRILPDGCLDLIWDDGRLLVAGPDLIARVLSDPRGPLTGVRLHGGRGPAALGVPADELTGQSIWLADLWGERRARKLTDRLAAAPTAALGEWAARLEVDPFGDRLLGLFAAGHDVGAAADQLGWSRRQVQRLTRGSFGYGPGHLIRILRMQRALAAATRQPSWAIVARTAGYADQAHLSRDLRALIGVTPTALRTEQARTGAAEPRPETG